MTKKTRRANTRRALLSLSLVLVTMMVAVGGTIAWLTDTTGSIENVFTVGNIDIDLEETTGTQYKMVPGNEIEKDPFVTVEAGSEDAWVFVKVVESANLDEFITYEIDGDWTELTEGSGVYYREYTAAAAASYPVLAGNKVTVNDTVTKTMMDALEQTGATQPTLTFTAYAIQKTNGTSTFTPAGAWAELNPSNP